MPNSVPLARQKPLRQKLAAVYTFDDTGTEAE